HWDTATGGWAVEPGEYRLSVGRSSRDLPITVTVSIDETPKHLCREC
ncbi:MAG: fibronectin type III-like domain-contianing protein, partial [Trebonia sp.]